MIGFEDLISEDFRRLLAPRVIITIEYVGTRLLQNTYQSAEGPLTY